MRSISASLLLGKPERSPGILVHCDALISFGFSGVDFAATLWLESDFCASWIRAYSGRRLALSHLEFADHGANGFMPDL